MADSGIFHDEVEIEDFDYEPETETFSYPCPCGDLFTIHKDDLMNGESVASCLSCTLIVKVVYEIEDIEKIIHSKTKINLMEPEKIAV
ncbi:CSL zinc finger containing protein [Sarcoptes scabiei]|nr:CSL zinc finger containing protein [Sarcoptes scabiei]